MGRILHAYNNLRCSVKSNWLNFEAVECFDYQRHIAQEAALESRMASWAMASTATGERHHYRPGLNW